MLKLLPLVVLALPLGPGAARADCRMAAAGAKCALPPAATAGPRLFEPGERLPADAATLLINSEYYGLPPSDGTWRYYRLGRELYRARPGTLEVIERATEDANPAF